MNDIFYPSHDGVTQIHACIWRPEGEIKGVVQIIHGMAEYAERYTPFARFLSSHGYLVCAEDHLGHGKSVVDETKLGYFNKQRSARIIIDDIRSLHLAVKKQAEGKPYFFLGHSMGSFFCRKYISLFGGELSGAVIMGTGFKSPLTLNFALAAVRLNALFCGWEHRSKLLTKLAFGSYNKKFKPARTSDDWLSVDKANVDGYRDDPLCGFTFTNNAYSVMFGLIKDVCSHKTISQVPKTLPVYFVAGGDDPVGNYGKGVVKAKKKFEAASVENVSLTLYEGARHEILNDFCKDDVRRDILSFLQKNVTGEAPLEEGAEGESDG